MRSNEVARVKAVLDNPDFKKIITEDDYQEITEIFDSPESGIGNAVATIMIQYGIVVESKKNNITIHTPLQIFQANEENLNLSHDIDPFIINPNEQISITNQDTGSVIDIPAVSYLLMQKRFHEAYARILQDEFNPSLLRNINIDGALKALAQYHGVDNADAGMLHSIQEAINDRPEIVKYINYASLATKSQIFAPEIREHERIFVQYKYTLDELTKIITNKSLSHVVDVIERGGKFGDLGDALEELAQTPQIFFLLNLGPVLTKDPNLATEMVRYIATKEGSIYGHIASLESDMHIIKPVLAYAVDHQMGELAAMLMAQVDPLDNATPQEAYPEGHGFSFIRECPMHSLNHLNHVIYQSNLENNIETPVLIYLMRADFAAAECYIRHHENHKSAIEFGDDDSQVSALELSMKFGYYTLEKALDVFGEKGGMSGEILSEVIRSPEDVQIVHRKFDLKTSHGYSLTKYEGNIAANTPLIIYFMEKGRWDIVDEMIKIGVDLCVKKTGSNIKEVPSAFQMALDHGYERADLMQNLDLSLASPSGIMILYNQAKGLMLDLVKAQSSIAIHNIDAIEGLDQVGTILHHAIAAGADDLFDAILERVTDVYWLNSVSPILFAIKQGNKHAVAKLLGHPNVSLFVEDTTSANVENAFQALLKFGYTVERMIQIISESGRVVSSQNILTLAKTNEEVACQLLDVCKSAKDVYIPEFETIPYNSLIAHAVERGHFKLAYALLGRDDINLEVGIDSVVLLCSAILQDAWELAATILNHPTFIGCSPMESQNELFITLSWHADHESRDHFMTDLVKKFPGWTADRLIDSRILDRFEPGFIGKYFYVGAVGVDAIFGPVAVQLFQYCLYTQNMDILKALCANERFALQDEYRSMLLPLGIERMRAFFNDNADCKVNLFNKLANYPDRLKKMEQFFASSDISEDAGGDVEDGTDICVITSIGIDTYPYPYYLILKDKLEELVQVMSCDDFEINMSILSLMVIKWDAEGALELVREHPQICAKILLANARWGNQNTIKKLIALENSPFSINVQDEDGKTLASYIQDGHSNIEQSTEGSVLQEEIKTADVDLLAASVGEVL